MPLTKCYGATGEVSKVDGGYLFSETALRDTVAGWGADREAVSILRQGMDELKGELDAQNESTRRSLGELKQSLAAERVKAKRGKVNAFLLGVIIGAAAGAVAASR